MVEVIVHLSFQQKWYIINTESNIKYEKEIPIEFITNSIESSPCDHFWAFILVTVDMTVAGGNVNTKVAFKTCTPFKTCWAEINDIFVDEADYIYTGMHK